MRDRWLAIGAVLGGLGVALGAFGAHGLKAIVEPALLVTFETGVRYHLIHALALLILGSVSPRLSSSLAQISGWLFLSGTVVFSGSLYLLTVTGMRWLGAITPIGGTMLIAGWICLAIAAVNGDCA